MADEFIPTTCERRNCAFSVGNSWIELDGRGCCLSPLRAEINGESGDNGEGEEVAEDLRLNDDADLYWKCSGNSPVAWDLHYPDRQSRPHRLRVDR